MTICHVHGFSTATNRFSSHLPPRTSISYPCRILVVSPRSRILSTRSSSLTRQTSRPLMMCGLTLTSSVRASRGIRQGTWVHTNVHLTSPPTTHVALRSLAISFLFYERYHFSLLPLVSESLPSGSALHPFPHSVVISDFLRAQFIHSWHSYCGEPLIPHHHHRRR